MGKLRNQKRKKTSKKKINVGKAVLFDVFTQEKNNKNEEGSASFTTGSEKEKMYYQMAMQGRQQQLKEEEEEEEEMQLNQVMIFSPTKNKTSLKNKSPPKKIQFIDPYSKLPQEVIARTHSQDDDEDDGDTDDANDADDDMAKETT